MRKASGCLSIIQTDRHWENNQVVSPIMAIHALLVLLLTSMAGAVDIFGSNSTLQRQGTQLTLIWETPHGTLNPLVEPLTIQAGRGAGTRSHVRLAP